MLIEFVELQNFRKLKSVRIDFSEKKTLFVGANNSGKTSAMFALGNFLVDADRFTTNDFTLCDWIEIEKIGTEWENQAKLGQSPEPEIAPWEPLLPALDVWLTVANNEVHYVQALLPTLDWAGGRLGVRMRFEPDVLKSFRNDYLTARKAAGDALEPIKVKDGAPESKPPRIWPHNLRDYLDQNLRSFKVRTYILDPAKLKEPVDGVAHPQALAKDAAFIEGNPLLKIVWVDEIGAQRGFGEQRIPRASDQDRQATGQPAKKVLSEQLRAYYDRHLDPALAPEASDLEALQAIEKSQAEFNKRLRESFAVPLNQLASLNYPGVNNPRLTIATKLKATDGLRHNAAVQYEVMAKAQDANAEQLLLPEDHNGLGYQHLISMVFSLMSFRDRWMRVEKAAKKAHPEDGPVPPLHLMLVEEPEAHLHPQVQQVFVREAYEILRNHKDLGDKPERRTQLIVSTHSSHVAHETDFACLRYFRRQPPSAAWKVPTSTVTNLTAVFGPGQETASFVKRYLRSTHCELFFADAAIFVEGAGERILVPHFVRTKFKELNRAFVTLLEVHGSHGHRLKPLINSLGLTTLVITDLDSTLPAAPHNATRPERNKALRSGNHTLRIWHPGSKTFDELLDLPASQKILKGMLPEFSVRVAYQTPMALVIGEAASGEILASTFEDALTYANYPLCQKFAGGTMANKIAKVAIQSKSIAELAPAVYDAVRANDKAEFALDLLENEAVVEKLEPPGYIEEGLAWLEEQLRAKDPAVLLMGAPQAPVSP